MLKKQRKRIEESEKCFKTDRKQLERAKVYLKAISDLYVFNLLETTVFYDESDCDGYCLKENIDAFLENGV